MKYLFLLLLTIHLIPAQAQADKWLLPEPMNGQYELPDSFMIQQTVRTESGIVCTPLTSYSFPDNEVVIQTGNAVVVYKDATNVYHNINPYTGIIKLIFETPGTGCGQKYLTKYELYIRSKDGASNEINFYMQYNDPCCGTQIVVGDRTLMLGFKYKPQKK